MVNQHLWKSMVNAQSIIAGKWERIVKQASEEYLQAIFYIPWSGLYIRPLFLNEWYMALGIWEPYVKRNILTLRRNDIFIDVGAHIGYHSKLAYSQVGRNGLVLCIEPDPHNIPILKRNVGGHPQTCIIQAALGSTRGYARFVPCDNPLFSYLDKANSDISNTIQVEMITLNDLVDYIKSSYKDSSILLKIDVEGAEVDVVKGGLTLIGEYLPDIIVETSGKRLGELSKLLSKYDYKFKQMVENYYYATTLLAGKI